MAMILQTFTFGGGVSDLLSSVEKSCEGDPCGFQLGFQFRASTQELLVQWKLALKIDC